MSSFICCNPAINPNYISPTLTNNFCNLSSSSNPSSIYQRQKIIQNTVRVKSSLYTMNVGALNVYQTPDPAYQVNWKQFSDRRNPHIQEYVVPSTRSTKHSYTWHRPCCQSPGGKGVDMKHGSYDRYLARIKGKSPLRRGVVPPIVPSIPFNVAFPVYGGKTFKTSIVSGYDCPICLDNDNNKNIYITGNNQKPVLGTDIYKFNIGDFVLVSDNILGGKLIGARVLQVLSNDNYLIQLDINGQQQIVNIDSLFIQPNLTGCTTASCINSNNITIPNITTITTDPTALFERIYI